MNILHQNFQISLTKVKGHLHEKRRIQKNLTLNKISTLQSSSHAPPLPVSNTYIILNNFTINSIT